MAKAPPDFFATLPDPLRQALVRNLVTNLFGPANGARVWRQLEPAMTSTARQLGDASDPEQNYWQGVWRIYDVE